VYQVIIIIIIPCRFYLSGLLYLIYTYTDFILWITTSYLDTEGLVVHACGWLSVSDINWDEQVF